MELPSLHNCMNQFIYICKYLYYPIYIGSVSLENPNIGFEPRVVLEECIVKDEFSESFQGSGIRSI